MKTNNKFEILDVIKTKKHETGMILDIQEKHAIVATNSETVGMVKLDEIKLVFRIRPILQNMENLIKDLVSKN